LLPGRDNSISSNQIKSNHFILIFSFKLLDSDVIYSSINTTIPKTIVSAMEYIQRSELPSLIILDQDLSAQSLGKPILHIYI